MTGQLLRLLTWAVTWALLLAAQPLVAQAALPDSTVPVLQQAPGRLVYTQQDLAACWADGTAGACVLRASITIDEPSWRRAFAATGGVAVQNASLQPLTLTSDPCAVSGKCLGGVPPDSQPALDFGGIPGLLMVESGGQLRLVSLRVWGLANRDDYRFTPAQPYLSVGVGAGLFPTAILGPNSSLFVVNSSFAYADPTGGSEGCVACTARTIYSFQQLYNVSVVGLDNATTGRVRGSISFQVPVKRGDTGERVGLSSGTYQNVTFTCVDVARPPARGPPARVIVPAIVVPLAAALSLLAAWLVCRCQRKRSSRPPPPVLQQQSKDVASVKPWTGAGDPEAGTAGWPSHSGAPASPFLQHQQQPPATASSAQAAGAAAVVPPLTCRTRRRSLDSSSTVSMPSACADTPSADTPPGRHSLQALAAAASAAPSSISISSRHGSAEPGPVATPKSSADLSLLGSTGQSTAPSGAPAGGRYCSAAALLKARSDVAVLRDLKIGPLLGRGSYGRVYRGRWKATTVAVKIIEHNVGNRGTSSAGAKRVSAGRESFLATNVSHPNVVTTYHISTMTMGERSALASKWLQEAGATAAAAASSSSRPAAALEPAAAFRDAGSPLSSDDEGEPAPQLLETWIMMEFCEKGCLERARKQGKFKRRSDGLPELVTIYKALLDTASGLDYLHSVGIVHGDLKAANVLLKGSTSRESRAVTCKITDFGLSRVLDMDATHISTGTYGTIVYMPKELLLSGRMTQATDIYSFGLLMWELLTSESVLEEGLTIGQVFYMIAYQGWRPALPSDCPPGYAELMTECWADEPEQRPTAQQLLKRLQQLYVRARQQAAAEIAAAHSQASPAQSASSSACCSALRVSFEEVEHPRLAQGHQPQQQLQASSTSTLLLAGSLPVRSSFEASSSSLDSQLPASHRSIDSSSPLEWQPYAQAVLQRAATFSAVAASHISPPVSPATAAAVEAFLANHPHLHLGSRQPAGLSRLPSVQEQPDEQLAECEWERRNAIWHELAEDQQQQQQPEEPDALGLPHMPSSPASGPAAGGENAGSEGPPSESQLQLGVDGSSAGAAEPPPGPAPAPANSSVWLLPDDPAMAGAWAYIEALEWAARPEVAAAASAAGARIHAAWSNVKPLPAYLSGDGGSDDAVLAELE